MCNKSMASGGQISKSARHPKFLRRLALGFSASLPAMRTCASEPGEAVIRRGSLMHKPATVVHHFRSILLCCCFLLSVAATAQPLVNLGLVGVGRLPADSFDFVG